MTSNRDDSGEKGFKVDDKRRFDVDGTARDDGAPSAKATHHATTDSGNRATAKALPAIDFSTFILSLLTSAMVHLGEGAYLDGTIEEDFELARQTIDILGMLREKTRGNLSPEESKLLDETLYDLRLKYVAKTK